MNILGRIGSSVVSAVLAMSLNACFHKAIPSPKQEESTAPGKPWTISQAQAVEIATHAIRNAAIQLAMRDGREVPIFENYIPSISQQHNRWQLKWEFSPQSGRYYGSVTVDDTTGKVLNNHFVEIDSGTALQYKDIFERYAELVRPILESKDRILEESQKYFSRRGYTLLRVSIGTYDKDLGGKEVFFWRMPNLPLEYGVISKEKVLVSDESILIMESTGSEYIMMLTKLDIPYLERERISIVFSIRKQ